VLGYAHAKLEMIHGADAMTRKRLTRMVGTHPRQRRDVGKVSGVLEAERVVSHLVAYAEVNVSTATQTIIRRHSFAHWAVWTEGQSIPPNVTYSASVWFGAIAEALLSVRDSPSSRFVPMMAVKFNVSPVVNLYSPQQ
jgi:hypothetical protein